MAHYTAWRRPATIAIRPPASWPSTRRRFRTGSGILSRLHPVAFPTRSRSSRPIRKSSKSLAPSVTSILSNPSGRCILRARPCPASDATVPSDPRERPNMSDQDRSNHPGHPLRLVLLASLVNVIAAVACRGYVATESIALLSTAAECSRRSRSSDSRSGSSTCVAPSALTTVGSDNAALRSPSAPS